MTRAVATVAVQMKMASLLDYWRTPPGPLDGLDWDEAAAAVAILLDGGDQPEAKEPPPPLDWDDWPRTPEEAARRLALEWHYVVPMFVERDDMERWIVVRGVRSADSPIRRDHND